MWQPIGAATGLLAFLFGARPVDPWGILRKLREANFQYLLRKIKGSEENGESEESITNAIDQTQLLIFIEKYLDTSYLEMKCNRNNRNDSITP